MNSSKLGAMSRFGTAAILVLSACGSDEPQSTETAQAVTTPESETATLDGTATVTASPSAVPSVALLPLQLVALGDSDATGAGDATGQGWVARYANLVRQETGREVAVTQRAQEGLTSARLLAVLQNDEALRTLVANADIIVIGEGGSDLNAGDDAFASGTCAAEACYQDDIAAFGQNIEAQVDVIARLRDDKPTVLRAITLPNGLTGAEDVIPEFLRALATELGVYQATSLRQAICSAMENHGGKCIDVLTAFNGAAGTDDAYELGLMNHQDCCYPSGDGQQRIAQLLIETGLDPTQLTSNLTPTTNVSTSGSD